MRGHRHSTGRWRGAASRWVCLALAAPAMVASTGCGSGHSTTSTHRSGSASTSSTTSTGATPGPSATTTTATAASIRLDPVRLRVPPDNRAPSFTSPHTVLLPHGWNAEVWALVPKARLEAWTPEHDLLVSSPDQGTVTELYPRKGKPAAPPARRTIISGMRQAQGLAFDRIDGHEVLYVAGSGEVDRYIWKRNGVTGRRVLISGLPDTQPAEDDVHTLKEVVVGSDHTIYVDVGSGSNARPRTSWHGIPRASVLAYHPNGKLERVWAAGVRNGDGLSIAPDGALWSAVNERDQISYPFHHGYGGSSDAYNQVITAYVNNHPPDEVARLTPGRDLGWPYCDPDPDVHPGALHTAFRYTNLPFIRDAQTNPRGQRLNCSKLPRLQVGLPAHSAPLGFHFLIGSKLPGRWADGAVTAGHGSWDRHPPRPPVVYWMPWEKRTHTLGAPNVVVSGFQDPDGNRWGRLADAVPGPDGALYVSDDQGGAILRIVPIAGG